MLIKCRHEDDVGRLVATELLDDLESIRRRHLDVEEHEIGRELPNRGERLGPRRGLADDLDVTFAAQQSATLPSRGLFVVDDQDAHGRNGMAIATANPKPPLTGLLPTLNRWASP